jgi:large subunit ribosomal protein L25
MSTGYTLKAEVRKEVGKGSARKLRRHGKIPAIIYGENQHPLPISISRKEIDNTIHSGGFRTKVAIIELNHIKIQVLAKDYQLDLISNRPTHVDFLRISSKSVVHVRVPVRFFNEEACPGIKQGSVLNIVQHEIDLIAPAIAIPESIQVDLTGYESGASIHISSIKLAENINPLIQDRDFTLATIAAPASS